MKNKRKWLQCHTLYTEIQEIVLDMHLRSSHPTPSSNSQVSHIIILQFVFLFSYFCDLQ